MASTSALHTHKHTHSHVHAPNQDEDVGYTTHMHTHTQACRHARTHARTFATWKTWSADIILAIPMKKQNNPSINKMAQI